MPCAAPYKHFANQNARLQAIVDHINKEWYARRGLIVEKYAGDTGRQPAEISAAHISFPIEFPGFRSTIMMKDMEDAQENMRRNPN